ncbi:MAG: MobA/MobL family protein [Oscillospiraceae bacterium]|nr:MobA/MobL family protein [Oscillospiraceae bacterium]
MPCPYFEIKKLTRKLKSHVVDRAAYLAGERLREELTNETKNHTDKDDVICSEILLPDNAPREYADRGTLWNAVDAVESRKNAKIAREVIMAVPKELTMEDNIKMVREYCMEQFVSRGMIADISFHDPKHDYHNPHAHVLLTVRALDENGQWMLKRHLEYERDEEGNKIRTDDGKWKVRIIRLDWDERDLFEKLRQAWEDIQNAFLEAAGRPERVSMKSYKEQGIDRIPQIHMTPAVVAMERKGIRTRIGQRNELIKKLNAQKEAEERAAAGKGEPAKETALIERLLQRFSERQKETGSSVFLFRREGVSDSQRFEEIMDYMRANGICSLEDIDSRHTRADSERRRAREQVTAVKNRLKTVNRLLEAGRRRAKSKPVHDEYLRIRSKKRREKFAEEHRSELDDWEQADSFIKKTLQHRPFDAKALRSELASLNERLDKLNKASNNADKEFRILRDMRDLVQVLMPEGEHEIRRFISGVKGWHVTLEEWVAVAMPVLPEVPDGVEIQQFVKPQRTETDMEL